jgi:hypothetical protein
MSALKHHASYSTVGDGRAEGGGARQASHLARIKKESKLEGKYI